MIWGDAAKVCRKEIQDCYKTEAWSDLEDFTKQSRSQKHLDMWGELEDSAEEEGESEFYFAFFLRHPLVTTAAETETGVNSVSCVTLTCVYRGSHIGLGERGSLPLR